jgi:hypothetical protein
MINKEIMIFVAFIVIVLFGLLLIHLIYPNVLNFGSENFGDVTSTYSRTKSNNYLNQEDIPIKSLDDKENNDTSQKINNSSYGDNFFLDVGLVNLSLHQPLCSKSCCSPQFPLPFSLPSDKMICDSKDEYIPSGISCNNGFQDSGCLCMTKDTAKFIANRGGNT